MRRDHSRYIGDDMDAIGRCITRPRHPFGALHLIVEDSLLPVQSSAASNGPNTDRMGRSRSQSPYR
jgi:hypothetical protein